MDSVRNNFDCVSSPPCPRQAWSGQESPASERSRVSSDGVPQIESSCEILNSFSGGSSTPVGDTRPLGSPWPRERPEDFESSTLSTQTSSDNSFYAQSPCYEVTSPSGPVPVPRKRTASVLDRSTRLEKQNQELVKKLEEVKGETSALKIELNACREEKRSLEELNRTLTTKNLSLQGHVYASQREQDLERQVEQLAHDLSQAQLQSTLPSSSVGELAEVREELECKRTEVASLREQKREVEKRLSALTIESCDASISSMASRTGGSNPPKRIEIRLNDAYKEIKAKQSEIDALREQLDEHNTGAVEELERTRERLRIVTQQKQDLDTRVQELSQQLHSSHSQLHTLTDQQTLASDKLSRFERSLLMLQEEKQRKDTECDTLKEQLSKLQEKCEEYMHRHTTAHTESMETIQDLTEQLDTVTMERDNLKGDHEKLRSDYDKMHQQCNDLDSTLSRLKGQREKDTIAMQEAFEEIKKEAGDTLGSYNAMIEKLGEVEAERDQFRMKHDQAMNILAVRSQELRECERKWSVELKEKLEQQRQEAEQMQEVIRAQMATYREDFNEERKAREKMVDEKLQLSASLKAKSEEIRALKMKLNEQAAAINMQDDDFIPSHYPEDNGPPLRAQDPYQQIPYQGVPRQNY